MCITVVGLYAGNVASSWSDAETWIATLALIVVFVVLAIVEEKKLCQGCWSNALLRMGSVILSGGVLYGSIEAIGRIKHTQMDKVIEIEVVLILSSILVLCIVAYCVRTLCLPDDDDEKTSHPVDLEAAYTPLISDMSGSIK